MSTHRLFVTLFLGLVAGPQPVEVKVDDAVKSVAIVLDGRTVARLSEAPWRTVIDLGPSIVPQQLMAIAYDGKGVELARQTQTVNLARPFAEAAIALERGGERAVVRWQHLYGEKPQDVRLLLDQKPLLLDRDYRVTLPKVDMNAVHVLSAEVRFPDAVTARKELVFGGLYSDEMPTELSGILVTTAKDDAGLADAQCFTAGDAPVRAAAIERPESLVVIVRDPLPDEAASHLAGSVGQAIDAVRNSRFSGIDARVRFVWPVAKRMRVSDDSYSEVFPHSADLPGSKGLQWYLTRVGGEAGDGPLRFADAVAVAGVRALEGTRRRVVVLVIGRDRMDASRHDATSVRRYLASIGVPLKVWSLVGPTPEIVAKWGAVEDVSSFGGLLDAIARLKRDLEQQRIAWLAADPVTALRVAARPGCAFEPVAHR